MRTGPKPLDVVDFIASMTGELSKMAAAADLDVLSRMLEEAATEAQQQAEAFTAGQKGDGGTSRRRSASA
jgi:hypothetical protein